MATIIDQKDSEELSLEEGEEYGDISELVATPERDEVAEQEEEVGEEEPTFEVPAKFKGKSVEDIVQSYTELEREYGRRSNEIGELRKITDEILKSNLQVNAGGSDTVSTKHKIEVDDLLEDPDTAIENALSNSPKLRQLEEQIKQAEQEKKRKWFESQHPDAYELVNDPGFISFLEKSPVRKQLFLKAHQEYDYDMGAEIFSLYKEVMGNKVNEAKEQQKVNRDKALKAASTEKGGTGQSTKKIFRRTDILKMMRNNPDKYNDPSFQEELVKAYQEGRVR